jgi:hypothetical protein
LTGFLMLLKSSAQLQVEVLGEALEESRRARHSGAARRLLPPVDFVIVSTADSSTRSLPRERREITPVSGPAWQSFVLLAPEKTVVFSPTCPD